MKPKIEYGLLGGRVVYAPQEAANATLPPPAYVCQTCTQPLTLRHTKTKYHGGRYNVPAFFAHQCASSRCAGASGESLLHLRSKYIIQSFVGSYFFRFETCPSCRETLGFISTANDRVHIEAPVVLEGNRYYYDALVSRSSTHAVAVEILYTHQTPQEKIDASEKHGIRVVELRASDVIAALPRLQEALRGKTHVCLDNLLFKQRVCSVCATLQFYNETAHDAGGEWVSRCRALEDEHAQHYAQLVPPLVAELRRLAAGRRLRGLKRTAFERACEYAAGVEEAQKYHRPGPYNTAVSFKCCECGVWNTHANKVSRFKFSAAEYEQVQQWYVQKSLELPEYAKACDLCTIPCLGCNEPQLLQASCKYGLCRECNIKSWYAE
jgi:hypothetical protein